MGVTGVIDRMGGGDLEGGISSLQNPSGIIERLYQAYSFWNWGTLVLAVLIASFTTIVRIAVFRIRNSRPISSVVLLVQDESDYDTDSEFSDDDESEDDEEEEEEDEEEEEEEESGEFGSTSFGLRLRRRSSSIGDFFSWPEFANGTSSVVKLWDNLNLGLGLDLNLNGDHDLSPSVIAAAEANILRVWDSRVGCRIPQILAEWRPKLGMMVGVNGAGFLEKVYLKEEEEEEESTVADMRKVSSSSTAAVSGVTESDNWWD